MERQRPGPDWKWCPSSVSGRWQRTGSSALSAQPSWSELLDQVSEKLCFLCVCYHYDQSNHFYQTRWTIDVSCLNSYRVRLSDGAGKKTMMGKTTMSKTF